KFNRSSCCSSRRAREAEFLALVRGVILQIWRTILLSSCRTGFYGIFTDPPYQIMSNKRS
ncbi:MAG: hypothetical protein WBI57_02035, partial [Desulfobacterales bacterium]